MNEKTSTLKWVEKVETHRAITNKQFAFLSSGDSIDYHKHYLQGKAKEKRERQPRETVVVCV